ncbi:HD-GYP domain-containing protein [Alicyclobacillus mengziensis]|uniref:HD-GYP domain-containing protein n=1 Tax=Alicyclobacillus mengziensis TaxID=2931921 RepID=A0A9X7W2Q0_9BACL|nr:HD-GYP domain-containing protein [Alicyclobacillus mengziensis]QSO49077.1 HD-GYP domain-containing protein [Alicyclobacillus mengziensis]
MEGNFRLDQGKRKTVDEELVALHRLLRRMEANDAPLALHSMRVAALATELAAFAGVSEWEMRRVYFGALLHDVGKLAIAGEILEKPGRLTQSEYLEIQSHPVIGARMVAAEPNLHVYEDIVRHHHERPDGTGYPDSLTANEIQFEVRMVSIADAFDAMTSTRAYRPALSAIEAIHELQAGVGTQFDATLVALFARRLQARNTSPCHLTYGVGLQSLPLLSEIPPLATVTEGHSRFPQ